MSPLKKLHFKRRNKKYNKLTDVFSNFSSFHPSWSSARATASVQASLAILTYSASWTNEILELADSVFKYCSQLTLRWYESLQQTALLQRRLLSNSAHCANWYCTAHHRLQWAESRASLGECSDEKYHICVFLQFEWNCIWEFLLSSMHCWNLLKLLFLTYNVKCQMCDLIVLGEPSNIMIMKDGTI